MAYGVVEFNHVAAQKTGRVFAQLPASSGLASAASNMLENGMIVVYDSVDGEVRLPTSADTVADLRLHKSAEKLYDKFANELSDFALDLTQGVYPRVYALQSGDTYTVTLPVVAEAIGSISVGDTLYADVDGGTGGVTIASGTNNIAFAKVVKLTTGPNGSDDAIKVEVL